MCPHCQGTSFCEGFVEDMGQASQGYARWIPGPLERGLFGGAARFGKQRYPIAAHRCGRCGYLALFVTGD
ncbi:hypothetical protein G5V58_20120 [Nocardioides anomalus]|uniref:Uncharacterized protein n=1 Tax=Nocardioides anomalus TaxID=2712223 RepID=A0A6G6WLK6_9ACTN|nr:hypothetical protein G5V58_20120 [Nocardioides anomalus]